MISITARQATIVSNDVLALKMDQKRNDCFNGIKHQMCNGRKTMLLPGLVNVSLIAELEALGYTLRTLVEGEHKYFKTGTWVIWE